MINLVNDTVEYFRSPENYFWHWADNGLVIEWKSGTTICYRDELAYILKRTVHTGVPSLGAVLLILAACSEKYDHKNAAANLSGVLSRTAITEIDPDNEAMQSYILRALDFMELVSQLPFELRRRQRCNQLLYEVFNRQPVSVPVEELHRVADELLSGRLTGFIVQPKKPYSCEQYKQDLEYLTGALQRFPTAAALETKIRTGIQQLPNPVELEISATSGESLFDELAEDIKTAGVSRLAKRIIAALNIPMHSRLTSDLPHGGISDITNRGSYDRLLLSELANDEILLTARLVNNEALYYRREEPPGQPGRKRVVLIDASLKMWGVPRVFAIGAGIACANNTKHGEQVEAYMLGGEYATPANLCEKQGILKALETMDHSMHCGQALLTALKESAGTDSNDYFFITGDTQLTNPAFNVFFNQARLQLHFVITVSRSGDLQLLEYINGRSRLLTTARLSLDELLFATVVKSRKPFVTGEKPAFIAAGCTELYFPSTGILPGQQDIFYHHDIGVIAITTSNRLLYWPDRKTGALEIDVLPDHGPCYFGYDGNEQISIMQLAHDRTFIAMYTLEIQNRQLKNFTCERNESARQPLENKGGYFMLKDSRHLTPFFRDIKKFINNGYSTLLRITSISITTLGELNLDGHTLHLANPSIIKIQEKGKRATVTVTDDECIKAEKQEDQTNVNGQNMIKLEKWMWPDGSLLFPDSRGLLHFKSSDPSLPEFTLLLVLGKAAAGWAADGFVAGASYFLHINKATRLEAGEFYTKYISEYINRIMH